MGFRMDITPAMMRDNVSEYEGLVSSRIDADLRGRDAAALFRPVPDDLVAKKAIVFILRRSDGEALACLHTTVDGAGVVHLGGLVRLAGDGNGPRYLVAAAVCIAASAGRTHVTAGVRVYPQGYLRDAEGRDLTLNKGSYKLLQDLGFEARPAITVPIRNDDRDRHLILSQEGPKAGFFRSIPMVSSDRTLQLACACLSGGNSQ